MCLELFEANTEMPSVKESNNVLYSLTYVLESFKDVNHYEIPIDRPFGPVVVYYLQKNVLHFRSFALSA